MKGIASFALAFLFLLTSNAAHAVFGTPYITPDHPTAGQTISLNIYQGGCDAIGSIPGYPQITQTGNAVRILFNGVRYTDPELCNLGFGTATQAVGAFPAGPYTLQVDLRYPDAGGDFVVETLGIVSFSVAGATVPVAAPAYTAAGLFLLTVLMVLAALTALRARRMNLLLLVMLIAPIYGQAQSARRRARRASFDHRSRHSNTRPVGQLLPKPHRLVSAGLLGQHAAGRRLLHVAQPCRR